MIVFTTRLRYHVRNFSYSQFVGIWTEETTTYPYIYLILYNSVSFFVVAVNSGLNVPFCKYYVQLKYFIVYISSMMHFNNNLIISLFTWMLNISSIFKVWSFLYYNENVYACKHVFRCQKCMWLTNFDKQVSQSVCPHVWQSCQNFDPLEFAEMSKINQACLWFTKINIFLHWSFVNIRCHLFT